MLIVDVLGGSKYCVAAIARCFASRLTIIENY
jgi:hypothetical protein